MGLKYNKYRTFYLPKEIVDFLFITAHITPIKDNLDSEIIIGLSIINEILSKSNLYSNSNDYPFHYIPMDSRYLIKKYGNDYTRYIRLMYITLSGMMTIMKAIPPIFTYKTFLLTLFINLN